MTARGRVTVRDVSVRYGARGVLERVSLDLEPGERLAVVGRSGAGKTTLLRALAGLVTPDEGTVVLGGREVARAGQLLVAPERRGVGLVFQDLALWPHMSVGATLRYVAPGGFRARRRTERALLERVGLADRARAMPDQLSGGERQRLALARALASEPELLLLDEPFAHLDAPLRGELGRGLLELLSERGTSLILVTHQPREALELAHELLVLDGGQVREAGPLAQVVERPRSRAAVELLGLGSVVPGLLVAPGRLRTGVGVLQVTGDDDDTPAPLSVSAALVRPDQVWVLPDAAPASAADDPLASGAQDAGAEEAEGDGGGAGGAGGAGEPDAGDELALGVVTRCLVARPDASERRYALEVEVSGLRGLRATASTPLAPGTRVRLAVDGCCPLLS